MATYLISYDLVGPNRDYDKLIAHLRTYRVRTRPLESVWMIQTSKSAGEVRDGIERHVDSNDKILVVTVARGWGTRNIASDVTNWMRNHF